MKRIEYTLKHVDSVMEHLYGERGRKKLSVEKTEFSAVKSSKIFKGPSSGASHFSKGILREGGRLKAVETAAAAASPLAVGTIAGAVAASFYGVANMIRYARKGKMGVQAAKDTTTGSAGVGISTGLGVAAAKAVAGTSLVFGSTFIGPLVAGAATSYAGMAIWEMLFYKRNRPSKTN